jgi:hypothetical protein
VVCVGVWVGAAQRHPDWGAYLMRSLPVRIPTRHFTTTNSELSIIS